MRFEPLHDLTADVSRVSRGYGFGYGLSIAGPVDAHCLLPLSHCSFTSAVAIDGEVRAVKPFAVPVAGDPAAVFLVLWWHGGESADFEVAVADDAEPEHFAAKGVVASEV